MVARLPFDPIEETQLQWRRRWAADESMAAATSIARAHQIVLAAVDDALRPFELTFARYEALVLLLFSRRGSMPLGKMGSRLMVHPTSVTNIVDRLEEQALVTRVPHPTDRRTTLAELTVAGKRVAEQATKAVSGVAFGLGMLTERELRQLTRIVRKIRSSVGDFGAAPA